MDYLKFVEHHRATGADITIGALPVERDRASDFGLMKVDDSGRIVEFAEKPKGAALDAMRVDTTALGLDAAEAERKPFMASMGCVVFPFSPSRALFRVARARGSGAKKVERGARELTLFSLSLFLRLSLPLSRARQTKKNRIYVFKKDALLDLLSKEYADCNDFGGEIIPKAAEKRKVVAYLFNDYWEDIGTIKSFFEANLGLAHSPPRFEFYDPETPIYTSPRFLPPAKVLDCKVSDAIISHG